MSFLTLFEMGTRVLQKANRGKPEIGTLTLQQSFSEHLGVSVKFWCSAVFLEARHGSCWDRRSKQQRGAEGNSSGGSVCPELAVNAVRMKAWLVAA